MGIGYKELMILMSLAVPCIVIVIWLVIRLVIRQNRRSSSPGGQRPVADRLAELQSLLRAGHINTDEYAKQRASIISGV